MMKSKLYPLLAVALLAVGCSDPSVEIVEQDKSYKTDDNVTKVDIPKQFDYDPSNFVRSSFSSSAEVTLRMEVVSGVGSLSSDQIPVSVMLKRPATRDIRFTLTPDASLLESYPAEKTGFLAMPEGVLPTLELTIPAGQTSVDAGLRLTGTSVLVGTPGYVGALRLEAVDAPEDVKLLDVNKSLFIKIEVRHVMASSTTRPSSWVAIAPSDITPSTNLNLGASEYGVITDVTDGQINGSNIPAWWFWAQPGQNKYIELAFSKRRVIGFAIHSLVDDYSTYFNKLVVSTSGTAGSTWDNRGTAEWEGDRVVSYVSFATPLEIDRIRLSDLGPENGFGGILEIEVFTE